MGAGPFWIVWLVLGSVALVWPRYAYFLAMNQRRRAGQSIRPQDLEAVSAGAVIFYRFIGGVMFAVGAIGLVVVFV